MHPHTVDWLRNVDISADSVIAQKRWQLAEQLFSALDRRQIIDVLRIFLFKKADPEIDKRITDQILELDPDFPVSGNHELLRVMSGMVMAAACHGSTKSSTALALGVRAAAPIWRRTDPGLAEVVRLAEEYLLRKIG